MKCTIAELNVEILNRDTYLDNLCEKYKADFTTPDLTLSASDADIEFEKKLLTTETLDFCRLESVAICRKLGLSLHNFDAFMLHAATFELDGRGIAFFAKSGTGKSTHMLLWKRLFGDRLQVVNGDKPIITFENGMPFAHGTPWCGKEGLSQNKSVPLTDLCFIKRSDKNETHPLDKGEALKLLLEQIVIPSGSENIIKVLDMLDKTLSTCNLWEIGCDTDIASAKQSSSIILR